MRPALERAITRGGILAATILILAPACGDSGGASPSRAQEVAEPEASTEVGGPEDFDQVIEIDGDRGLYVRCSGSGSPTVVMEGGDGDTSSSYSFAEARVAAVTRACVYDRANLGQSDPDPGPRGLDELVGDLEGLLQAAQIPGPYVLVGTSGGGYITAGYAVENPSQIAGMVFIDTFSPFRDPPQEIVEETAWDHPGNVEERDYLQVEKDAWAARKEIGDIPVTVVSVKYSSTELSAASFPSERRAMRRNVQDQRGWLILSPQAKQIVVETGHAVEEADPQFVIDVILDVVEAAP
jgi:pimeloyl-ACP methyl ester carboxylesterase